MKLPLSILLLPFLASSSQAQVAVEDVGMLAKATETNARLAEQNAATSDIRTHAEATANRLQDLLKRVGNPATVAPVGAATAKDIEDSIDGGPGRLKPSATLLQEAGKQDGKLAFTEDVGGLFKPIGENVVSKDGKTTAPRDADKYKLESALLSRIKEYQTVRDSTLERKANLQAELRTALETMANATDDATVQKQQAIISLIQGQIASAEKEVDVAKDDIDILKLQIETEMRVQSTSRTEAKDMASKVLKNMRAVPAATKKALKDVLPWAKK